ncbi:family 16 glycoside hydrolase [Frankia sp. Cr2]|uniref:family 16 glycoside hydrolase n=1 Tax=Frankia sp. Cr2 TaxID=3073932 RepID=UPI002AD45498|nr:family 16 glycoside hydrolase [Frankia sp. Cr2]
MTSVRPLLPADPPGGAGISRGRQPAGGGSGLLVRLAVLACIALVSLLALIGLLGMWRLTGLFQEGGAMVRWVDGSRHGTWLALFDGYGQITGPTAGPTGDDEVISLAPKSAAGPGATHAALVVSADHYTDITVTTQLRTVRQLRTPGPQPWEVGWVLWHYTDGSHFYALALKTNGWEISKQDPAYPGGQRFLASGEMPRTTTATWHTIGITQAGSRITVAVDGALIADLVDPERPYFTGAVGLYCEDSDVEFRRIHIGTDPPSARPRS